MDTIGLDLQKRETQICSIAKDGTVTERRIAMSVNCSTKLLGVAVGFKLLVLDRDTTCHCA